MSTPSANQEQVKALLYDLAALIRAGLNAAVGRDATGRGPAPRRCRFLRGGQGALPGPSADRGVTLPRGCALVAVGVVGTDQNLMPSSPRTYSADDRESPVMNLSAHRASAVTTNVRRVGGLRA
jgi:hypothetical protein